MHTNPVNAMNNNQNPVNANAMNSVFARTRGIVNGGPRAARPLSMAQAVALKWITRYGGANGNAIRR